MASLLQKFKKKKSSGASKPPSNASNNGGKKPTQNSGPPPPKASPPSATSSEVRGILKNKQDAEKYHNTDSYPTSEDLDESLRNARKNMSINLNVTKDNNDKGNSQSQSSTASNILNNTSNIDTISEPLPSNAKETASDENIESINNNNNNESKNDNDNETDNDIKMDDNNRDLLWDEDNLRKNEEEKVPRMKIDEAPTPYHDMPDELLDENLNDPMIDDNEEILDINPMDMMGPDDSNDDGDISSHGKSVESMNSNNSNDQKALQQQRQAALLQDSDYQNKMINDALKRRDNDANQEKKPPKKIVSAWEDDGTKDSTMGSNDASDEADNTVQKKVFNKKRSAHYNEFYAVKAMKAQMGQEDDDDENV